MVGAAMDKKASAAHLPQDIERLALNWNADSATMQHPLMRQENTVSASGANLFAMTREQRFVGGRSVSAKAPNEMRS
jgi:hypothetical protein